MIYSKQLNREENQERQLRLDNERQLTEVKYNLELEINKLRSEVENYIDKHKAASREIIDLRSQMKSLENKEKKLIEKISNLSTENKKLSAESTSIGEMYSQNLNSFQEKVESFSLAKTK